MYPRRKSKVVRIGKVAIGGRFPVAIQSMTKYKTSDVEAVAAQVRQLAAAGCEIVRVAVRDEQDARAIRLLKQRVALPIVADIHFSWRLAVAACESGVDKIRLNPGNIFKPAEVREVVAALKAARIPLRVGTNSGSVLELKKHKGTMPQRLVEHALSYVRMIEKMKFHDIVISLKASTVRDTVEAYRRAAKLCAYPLHLGVTATGLPEQGMVKSAMACGILLAEGIGDTMRISLTDDPVREIAAAKAVLEGLQLRSFGPEIISCPTCGRCEVNLVKVVRDMEQALCAAPLRSKKSPKIALMGCVVNGPGEAREADIGVAFGKQEGLLFRHGKPVRKIKPGDCTKILLEELRREHDEKS
jgi:(E)-4-hydroxy-3-methylbut-2-enyl-diphosphate synthase